MKPKTDNAIPGIYFFDKKVSNYATSLQQSKRKEYEIVDLIYIYINKN
jgi:dTDP-glucose pyrophosphorylase